MKKYHNVPSYMKNLKRSGKSIISNQMHNMMPTLGNTVVSGRDAFKEFTAFDRSGGSEYGNYVKQRKNIIFGPLRDFIRNAKEDLKSGKFYNEERIASSTGNGIDDMLDGFGDMDEMMDEFESEHVRVTSKFDKYLKSTSASLSVGNKALSNSLNEVNINNTEYIANVNTMNSAKFMALTTKHHMEQMKQLKNIENIGMSMVNFNQEVIAGAIERQDKFYDEILNETRELKELIQQQTDFNMSRFKSGSKASGSFSALESILGSNGSLDLKEYFGNIKKNLKRQSPMDAGMFKELFKSVSASPISTALNFILPMLIPNDIKKGMGDLDKSIGGLFATYLLQMNNMKYNGKNSMARKLAEILGVNLSSYNKPNLSIYRNQDMTLEIEQKKAKAITEVIPTYLSKITEAMTGITKSYDYTRGMFVDKTKKRKEIIRDYKNNIYSDMYDTGTSLEKQYEKRKDSLSNKQNKYMERDLREFVTFLGTHTIMYDPNMTYAQLRKKGLYLRGGEESYRLIKRFYLSMSKTERMNVRTEQLQSIARRPGLNSRFDEDLQSSGDSALFNGMDEFDEDGNLITVDYIGGNGRRRNAKSNYNLRKNINKKKKDDNKKSKWSSMNDEVNSKVNDGVSKVLNKLGIKTSPIVGLLTGITDAIYGLSNGKGKATDKATDFMTTILKSIKTTIFGEYDEKNDVLRKEGILPQKVSKELQKYLPKTVGGASIGSLVGLTVKHPILGAIAGGALNILMETNKVKNFLWGDPNNDEDKGLFGALKDKLDKKVIDPLRDFLKDKFGDKVKDKVGDVKDKVDSFFDVYDDNKTTRTKRYRVKSASVKDILNSFTKSSSSGGGFQSGIINKITGELERGIYSSQLDTIIALLSGGFGYMDDRGNITSPNDNGGNSGGGSIGGRRYKPYTLTKRDYELIGRKIINGSSDNTNSASMAPITSGTLLLEADNRAASRKRRINKNKLRNDLKNTFTDPIMLEKAIDVLETENISDGVAPLTDNEIYERAIIDELKKNPSFAKHIKDVADRMLPHFKDKIEFIRKGIGDKAKSSSGSDDTILGNALGKIKTKANDIDFGEIKTKLKDRMVLNGIGKGRGGLIGMALGSMILGNPVLGAVAGMTFAGKSDKQKELEKQMGGSPYKPGRTAAKYGLISTLLGLGPMPGILLGALFPQKKKDPDREPSKLEEFFGGSSKKGKFIGGLTGLAFGGIPGMLIGGMLGGKLIGRKRNKGREYTKNDWDVRNELVYDPETGEVKVRERSKKEIKEYLKQRKDEQNEPKRRKAARGTIMDIITGGGKLRGGAVGSLLGLMIGGAPGMLLGGLGGTVLGTKRGNLDRDKTTGILSKQGKWKASVIGALIGNAFMGPVVGPLVGGLMGSMLARGVDKKFWRYDENGRVLRREQQKAQKQAFKKEYKYERDTESYNYDMWLYNRAAFNTQYDLGTIGPAPDINDPKYDTDKKRSFFDARRKRREIMNRENAIRDENAKKFNKNTDRKFNMDNLAVFNQSKATGAYKGAVMATQFLGPYATVAGAALGAITSKKRTPPDGSQKKPFYVKNVNDNPKTKDNPHGYDKKADSIFNRENKKNLEDIKNADTKHGDVGAEKQLKEVVDDIQKSSMNTKQKQESMDDVTKYTTAIKTSSGLVGGNGDNQGSGGGFFSELLGNMFGPLAARLIGGLFKYVIPIMLSIFGIKDMWDHMQNDEYDLAAETGGDLATSWARKISKSVRNAGSKAANAGDTVATGTKGLLKKAWNATGGKVVTGAKNLGRTAWNATGGKVVSGVKTAWNTTGGKLINKAASSIGNFKTNQVMNMAKNVTSDTAIKSLTNAADNIGNSKIISSLNTIKTVFSNALRKISESSIVKKIAPAMAEKMGKSADNIAAKVFNALAKNADDIAKTVATKGASATVKTGVKVIPYVGWAITAIQAIYDFISGYNDADNILGTDTSYDPPTGLKVTSGILKCLIGIIPWVSLIFDITGLRPTIVKLIYGFFASEEQMNELESSQASADANYEEFVRLNPGTTLTRDKYNEITNKSTWGKFTSFLGFGKTLDDYRTTDIELSDNVKNNTTNLGTSTSSEVQQLAESITSTNNTSEMGTTNNILLSILDSVNGLAGGAYVVQNNQKTVNIAGGSYDASINAANDAMNSMSGGRGSSDNFKNMVPRSLFRKATGRNNIPQISKNTLRRYNASSGRGITINKFNKKLTRENLIGCGGRGGTGDQVIQTAMQFLGQPYVWGGSSPSEGFDCSGLLQYSLAQNGINISRTTYDQVNEGTAVSKSDLQPGDAVFFGTADDVHHVGIYIGNGEYIHAPKTGDVIKISKLSDRSDFYAARRYTTPGTGSYSSSSNSNGTSSTGNSSLYSSNVTKGKALLQSKAQKPFVTSISADSTPKETVLSVTNNEDVQNILHTAYENDENFMSESEIADNKNIKKEDKTKEETSESFASKVLKGLKNAGGKVLNSGKSLLKKGANVVVRAAQWAWDKVKKGANWIGDKISGAWNWITGGRGDNTSSVYDSDYYNQQDPRWSNMSFGMYNNHRDTVGDGGCGPTTAATVLQKLTGERITPAETSRFALHNGYKLDDGGTTPDYFNAIGSRYGVNFNQSDPYSSETVSSLQQGKPVIFLGHDSTGTSPFGNDSHYVVGTGMDRNGNISILDPKNSSNNRVYNINDIAYNSYRSIVPNRISGGSKNRKRNSSTNRRNNKIRNLVNSQLKTMKIRTAGGRGVQITQNLIQNLNNNYVEKDSRNIEYIVIHYAANFDGKASGSANWYGPRPVSAHYAVGSDGIFQTVEDKNVAHHCGGETYPASKEYGGMSLHGICTNSNSIGIEIASVSPNSNYNGPYTFDETAVNNAIALVNELMAKYNIDKDHVVRHFDTTGKACPAPMVPKAYLESLGMAVASSHDDKAWDKFKSKLNGSSSSSDSSNTGDNGSSSSGNNNNSNSSSSSSSGSSIGGRLVNKLSGILDALSPKNNILDSILSTMYSAYDGDSSSSTSTSSSTSSGVASGSTGSRTIDYLGQQVSYDQAADHPITSYSKITADQLREAIRNYAGEGTWMETQVDNIIQASNTYGVDPRWIVAMAAGETGWNKEGYAASNSFFGIGAYDSNPDNTLNYANDTELDGWLNGVKWIKENYVDIGQDSLYRMKNPEAAGVDSWHSYQTGSIDTKVNIYKALMNATGGAGLRGGRGNLNKYLTGKLNKPNFKNPFNMKNKPNIIFGGRGSSNKIKINQTQPSMTHPIVSKYSTFDPIVKQRVNYGGRGFTPIPTTSSVIDALSLKGSNSVMRTIDNAMQKPTTKSSNNTNATLSIDTSKLDKGNEISNSILTVLKSIAITLERIERNSALSNNNNFNTITYGENGELAAQSYKAAMMNNIIAGN